MVQKSITVLLLVLALCIPGAGIGLAKIPISEFQRPPALVAPSLSPSGRYLAAARRAEDGKRTLIVVYDLNGTTANATGAVIPEAARVDWVEWANEDRLIIGLTELVRIANFPDILPGTSRVLAMDRDGKRSTILFSDIPVKRFVQDLTQIVHPLPAEPNHILMGANDSSGYYNLYKVDVTSGEAVLVERGNRATRRWLPDLQGKARARWDGDSVTGRSKVFLRKGEGDDWDLVAEYDDRDLPDLNIIGFGDDPLTAIVASRGGGDKYVLREYNIASRTYGRVLLQNANVDVGAPEGGPIYDPFTTKLVGFSYLDDVWFREFFEPDLQRVQVFMERHFQDSSEVSPVSWSSERKRFVVRTSGPRNPASYFLLDTTKNAVTSIGRAYPNLPESELSEVFVIKYPARDGVKIPGYLTMPNGMGDKNLPMIVMPHGGPELRDYVQYDEWAQFLANRGYLVFQPNFRGSGGYGKAFTEAGHMQWGRRMQDDITDGVKALIKDGTADPKRICIVGASYGGYAALAGGAFTPELYKCVVSIAGVSDIPLMMTDDRNTHGSGSSIYTYWKKWVGDPKVDGEQMKSVSPAYLADRFVAPVLLIHGTEDTTVRYSQSVRMDKALFKAKKQSKLVLIDGEFHSFFLASSRKKLFEELETFLGENLGNRN